MMLRFLGRQKTSRGQALSIHGRTNKKMKLVTAIIRTVSAQKVVNALKMCCVSGVTFSEVRGVGEGFDLERPYTIHSKLEVVVSDERADDVVQAILEHSRMGQPGDGIISVVPLDYQVEIRTREKLA